MAFSFLVHEVETFFLISPAGAVPSGLEPGKGGLNPRRRIMIVREDSAFRRPHMA